MLIFRIQEAAYLSMRFKVPVRRVNLFKFEKTVI